MVMRESDIREGLNIEWKDFVECREVTFFLWSVHGRGKILDIWNR